MSVVSTESKISSVQLGYSFFPKQQKKICNDQTKTCRNTKTKALEWDHWQMSMISVDKH